MSEAATKLQRAIDQCILYMGCSEWEETWGTYLGVTPLTFDGATPFLDHDVFETLGNAGQAWIFEDVQARDLSSPLNFSYLGSWIHPNSEEDSYVGSAGESDDYVLIRARSVTPKEVRGRVRWAYPTMFEVSHAFVIDGLATSDVHILAQTATGLWVSCEQPAIRQPLSGILCERMGRFVQVALGGAFSRRYQWTIYFGDVGLPGVTIPILPESAYELFQKRDEKVYTDRKAALRHWVESHWRTTTADPEYETFVRSHLRGKTKFTWNDYRCVIRPSAFDADRLTQLTTERKAMHREGTDKRLKVR